ncbi:glycosyltransferase family 4 protein [Pseudoalteromonas tunicata]|uniref:Glycosyl transferase, group 1 family protein n=1 Tax=Pseudoalteromonas tunicata D2 TaxID=87626 RepID=A4C649_9GAMM|nr:glycosyltransferase family 4 protein [Pseudoalteromonas tunicata]ATC95426.1 hypothetical protein PTUN_a3035 [Pseudoalteromonas tunicata]AXT31004.1 glycosyltransferase [Pseudoalteromonas tunicata]EAR29453.1 glycosyl transferase, group 1 family protein [Pseudoalteromonas tunicata D2]
MKNNKITKCLYFHYQKYRSDGSNTHTHAFKEHFGQLCNEQGIDFSVIAPTQVLPKEQDIKAESKLDKLKTHLAKWYLKDFKTLLANIARMYREIELLKAEQPDIVLTRYGGNTISIIWACRWLNIPVVLEFNSPSIESLTSDYRQFSYFKQLFSNQNVFRLASGAFAVSDEIVAEAKLEGIDKPFETIANGVDLQAFNKELVPINMPKSNKPSQEEIVIGFVGSFAPWHGVDLLITCFINLLTLGYKVHLLLVGHAKQDSRQLLARLNAADVKPHVTITGYVEREDIPRYIQQMDITTLPNTEDYCSPLKLFEYMAMAKPTVAVCTAPVISVMRSDIEGLVFERGDVQQFQAQLMKLIDKPELAVLLGKQAHLRVAEHFTWRHNAQNVMSLLEQVHQQY